MFPTDSPSGSSKARQEWSAVGATELPSWLSKVGGAATTLTFGSDVGVLEVECASVDGGLQVPNPYDTSNVSEVRIGASLKMPDTTNNNTVTVGATDTSGSIDLSNSHVRLTQYDTSEMVYKNNVGRFEEHTIGIPSIRDATFHAVELRLRISDNSAQVVIPSRDGDTVNYETELDHGTSSFYPSWGLNTGNESNTESFYVAKVWYEIRHN